MPTCSAWCRRPVERAQDTCTDWLTQNPGTNAATRAHRRFHRNWIRRFLERPYMPDEPGAPGVALPPGTPIGLLEQVLEMPR